MLGVPTLPGLAWAEGWATWHSAAVRQNSIFYDKQEGTFYFNIGTDRYWNGRAWQQPTPSGGLLQTMDENEVSSMLWDMLRGGVPKATFFGALTSPRMNHAPWARGYTWHYWTELDAAGRPLDPYDTGISRPTLPDFLDALVCGGVSPSIVDAATVPATRYPYPSSKPICQ